jgi:hypothetical protein
MHRPESASQNCQDERDATGIVGLIQLRTLKQSTLEQGRSKHYCALTLPGVRRYLMRKLVLGILGFAAIGFGAASFQPAQAQAYYPGYRQGVVGVEYRGNRGYRHGPRPVEYRGDRGYRPAFAPGPYGGGYGNGYGPRRHGYYRPVFAAPRCFVRMERAWNGWRWIRQPVRVCR